MRDGEVIEESEVPEPEWTQVAEVVNVQLVRSESSGRARATDGKPNEVRRERGKVVIKGSTPDLATELAVGWGTDGRPPREELAERVRNVSPRGQGALTESDRQVSRGLGLFSRQLSEKGPEFSGGVVGS